MKLHGLKTIDDWVKTVAKQSVQFTIITPFFSIDRDMERLLTTIPMLQLFVGDEFSRNNPRPLRRLSRVVSHDIRCIYKTHLGRRLHAKVFYSVNETGRRQAMIGSANFTVSGLSKNEEQSVSLDSIHEHDCPILDQIQYWIDDMQRAAEKIDWKKAISEFENSPNPKHSNVDFDSYPQDQTTNYWVLKTTEGSEGMSRWNDFVREGVISIGWTDFVTFIEDEYAIRPEEYTIPSLQPAANRWVNSGDSEVSMNHAVKMLCLFCREFSRGDRIILCRGYAQRQTADVYLYGLAIVDGEVINDLDSPWWRLKRSALLLRKEIDVPKQVCTDTLEKQSLRHTIHQISREQFDAFYTQIESSF